MPVDGPPIELNPATCAAMLPVRAPDSHKGTHGTLICVSGSLDYAGAALLCASAAARGGAGLVVLAVPRSLQPLFAGRVPEAITLGLPELADLTDIDPAAAGVALGARTADAFVFGPGVAETRGYADLLLGLLARSALPMVVDGGGLNLLARHPDWPAIARSALVLTPHPGEFGRLLDRPVGTTDEERRKAALRASELVGQVVVLKGARTVVAAPDGRLASASFANAALATAGSGDVLAGLIGALLAQRVPPFDAACLAVYLHGRAGQRISERLGDAGLLASDLPFEIALARHELSSNHG